MNFCARRFGRTITVEAQAEVDIDELLEDLSDDELLEELTSRGKAGMTHIDIASRRSRIEDALRDLMLGNVDSVKQMLRDEIEQCIQMERVFAREEQRGHYAS